MFRVKQVNLTKEAILEWQLSLARWIASLVIVGFNPPSLARNQSIITLTPSP